jgi:hypothetical protein
MYQRARDYRELANGPNGTETLARDRNDGDSRRGKQGWDIKMTVTDRERMRRDRERGQREDDEGQRERTTSSIAQS